MPSANLRHRQCVVSNPSNLTDRKWKYVKKNPVFPAYCLSKNSYAIRHIPSDGRIVAGKSSSVIKRIHRYFHWGGDRAGCVVFCAARRDRTAAEKEMCSCVDSSDSEIGIVKTLPTPPKATQIGYQRVVIMGDNVVQTLRMGRKMTQGRQDVKVPSCEHHLICIL